MADTVESLSGEIANLQMQIVTLSEKRLALLDPESQTKEAKLAAAIFESFGTATEQVYWANEVYDSNGVVKQDWNGDVHKFFLDKATKCLEVTSAANVKEIVKILFAATKFK